MVYPLYKEDGKEAQLRKKMENAVAPMGKFNGDENRNVAIDAREARKGLGQPIRLANQELPRQDLTEARHATPFKRAIEKPNSFTGGYDAARQSTTGFNEGGRAAQNLPPMASLGAGVGNAANLFLPRPREDQANVNQSFPSDLNAARRMAPQPEQQPMQLPSMPDNVGHSAGRFARESIVPAVDSSLRAAAGVASFIPRSIYNVGKDVVGGFMGQAPSNETTELLPFNKPMFGQSQPTLGPGNANAAVMQPQQRLPLAGRDDALRSMPYQQQTQQQPMQVGNQSRIAPTQVGSQGGAMGVNLSDRDKAIKSSLADIDNAIAGGLIPNAQQAEQIRSLREQAGFLRGGADRRQVGRDGLPIRQSVASQAAGGGNYSFQGSPEAAQRFNSAVSPGEYSQEAQSARNMQREQFLGRQGFERVDPATGMTPSQMRALKPAERLAFQKQGTDAEIARANLAVNQGTLANQNRTTESTLAGAGIDQEAKRMTIDEQRRIQGLQKTYNEAKTPEERAMAERSLIAAGALKRDKPEVFFDEERDSLGNVTSKKPYILENGNVRPAISGGDQRQTAPPEALAILAKNKNDQKTKKYFLDTFGYLPAGY